jgi:hypothetical protein
MCKNQENKKIARGKFYHESEQSCTSNLEKRSQSATIKVQAGFDWTSILGIYHLLILNKCKNSSRVFASLSNTPSMDEVIVEDPGF